MLDLLHPAERTIDAGAGAIVHVVEGFVRTEYRDYRLRLPAGTTIVCPPEGAPRLACIAGGKPRLLRITRWKRACAAVGAFMPSRAFGAPPGVVEQDARIDDAMRSIVRLLLEANTADPALEKAARRAMAVTLAAQHRSRDLARYCSGRTRRRRLEQYSRLARARAVLAWGDDPSLDIARVAAIAHMSTSHFIALFHRIFGRSPHQYRIECRMSQARRLLLDTTLSTIQIVHSLGIESTAAFARTFLRQFGLPASSLRRPHADDEQHTE